MEIRESVNQKDLLMQYDFTGYKVLLADDSILMRELNTDFLNMVNCELDCVNDGLEAVAQFAGCPAGTYLAILVDMEMPVMNGLNAARTIRLLAHSEAKTVPIIIMTGAENSKSIIEGLKHSFTDFLVKPVDCGMLYKCLKRYADRKKLNKDVVK